MSRAPQALVEVEIDQLVLTRYDNEGNNSSKAVRHTRSDSKISRRLTCQS